MRVNLTLKQKLEVIEKLESGVSVARLCEQYGIKKQTVSDIKKNKEKIKEFMLKCDGGVSLPRKHMKPAREAVVEEAVLKWYTKRRSCGAPVRGTELKSAAMELANSMNIPFKASDGWLWRFRKRHGIVSSRFPDEVHVEDGFEDQLNSEAVSEGRTVQNKVKDPKSSKKPKCYKTGLNTEKETIIDIIVSPEVECIYISSSEDE